MAIQTDSPVVRYEETLLRIVRSLPPERILEVVDFARFIQLQTIAADDDMGEGQTEDELRADEEKWDRLLARPEAQRLLLDMANEALEEHRAGRTTDIVATDDGRLAPA